MGDRGHFAWFHLAFVLAAAGLGALIAYKVITAFPTIFG